MRRLHQNALFAVALGTLLIASKANATIEITTDFPSGTPLVVAPGDTSSAMTARVFDPEPASGPNDNLTAYQVRLAIVPQEGAMGTLLFATPATGAGSEPANYLLPDNLGMSVTNSEDGLFLFDVFLAPPSTSGVDVPDSPGNNLLEITYSASADADGLFSIVALPGAINTIWTDNTLATREFTNLAGATEPVEIGEVLVSQALGDYNQDGTVDAADYVVWRKNPDAFGGDPAGYNTWRANFGTTAGGGAALPSVAPLSAVPEPSTTILLGVALLLMTARRMNPVASISSANPGFRWAPSAHCRRSS
jgi:hypothetical protein